MAPKRALTVKQPWAWLIVQGHKDIENRSWWRESARGERILIHAGQSVDRRGIEAAQEIGIELPPEALHGGRIVGSVSVSGYVAESDSPWFIGPLGWTLAEPQMINGPHCKGRLGLWRV